MAEGRSTGWKRGRACKRGRGKPGVAEGRSDNGQVAGLPKAKSAGGTRRKVHRLRFLKQTIYPVRCLVWEPHWRRLAVSRKEGSVEIWSFHPDPTRAINNACWYVERRIPGAISRKVETLVWCRRRLFAAGTSGMLLEFDAAFNVAREIPASAGGVVAMVANEKLGKIALASIDGTIVVYDVEENGLVYDRTLEKRTERIMSLAWHEDGDTLVSGCKGYILIWDFGSGRVHGHIALAKFLTKRKGKRGRFLQKSSLIWAVELLADGTIVTGDSEGYLSFWDVGTATLRTQFKTHDGPILTLSVAHDSKTVWCSGVDPRVVEVKRSKLEPTGWQLGHANALCTRDVHAMTHVHLPGHTSEGIIFAGDDPRLFITCVRKGPEVERDIRGKNLTRNAKLPLAPACASSMIKLSRKRGVVVSRVNRGVEIWRLGASSSSPSSQPNQTILPLDSAPTKLALIPGRKGAKDYYASAAINADATLLCLSDQTQTDVLSLAFPEDDNSAINDGDSGAVFAPKISKIKALNGILSSNLSFCDFCSVNDDELLVTLTAAGRLEALRIRSRDKDGSSSSSSSSSKPTFQKMTMALADAGLPTCLAVRTRRFRGGEEAAFAAVGFTSGRVEVVDLMDGRVLTSLPVLRDICVSAVAFSPDAAEVAAVYVNREMAFFRVDSQRTSYWPRLGDEPGPAWWGSGKVSLPVQKLVYLTPTKLLMHSDKRIHVLERDAANEGGDEEEESGTKRLKLADDGAEPRPECRFKTLPSFEVVHFVDAMDNGELVVAETTVEKVEEGMPQPLLKKKYGT